MKKGMPMTKATSFFATADAKSATHGWLGRFWRDQAGSMSYVAVAGSMVMMVFGGIGIDLIHAELKRTKLQNTLDRAVLAAADLDNNLDPTLTVESYFDAMGMSEALINVTVDDGLNYKTVTADGLSTFDANFLDIIGVDTLQAQGTATAEERIGKVEISLVLDISGSMAYGNKMNEMKYAAQTFVETVLDAGGGDLVSVSMVPYSEHVNAGPELTQHLNVNWRHGYSHCLEMPDSEFNSAELNTSMTYTQMQHYQWNYSGQNKRDDTVCPRYDYERINAFATDPAELTAQINQFKPRAGTSIFMGMKWATALLDPSTRFIADDMVSNGDFPAAMSGRPVDYDDHETLKTVVLMTDGQHDKSYRIQNWAYNSSSEVAHWNRYNLWYYLNRYVHWSQRSSFYEQKYTASYGDTLLDNICDAAKAQGIVVWTIGFEVTDHGASVMQNCASSPSHFFRVEGVEITDAFSAIARTINQLRLTQ